jgi:Zn-dependent protease with chaperone function
MIVAVESDKHKAVFDYVNEINEKFRNNKEDVFRNPIKGRVHIYDLREKSMIILNLNILAFPSYLFIPPLIFLAYLFPNLLTYSLPVLFLIFSFPFTSWFWYLFFVLGLRKKGVQVSVKKISPAKAWREYLGSD